MISMDITLDKQIHPLYPFFKRVFDVFFSLTFILVFSPIYIFLALLIKLNSKGPILYIGKRLGKQGKYIEILNSEQCTSMPKIVLRTCSITLK